MAYSDDPELMAILHDMAGVIGQAQAKNRATLYLLMAVVRDLARKTPDPEKYLSGMFEIISARADQSPLEAEGHVVTAEFRETIATFFTVARHGL
jgi:hypothetical protein